jgi:soluble lytic murein transglycosylase
MGGRVRSRWPRPWLASLGLALLGVLGCGCKRAPARPGVASGTPALSISSAAAPAPSSPVAIETAFVALNRQRRFADAQRLLSGLPPERSQLPAYRFVNAYLAVRTNEGGRALPLLDGLARTLPDLSSDIDRLRAEGQLQTGDALVGASWLAAQGRRDAWLTAARTLTRLGQLDAALLAIDRGLRETIGQASRITARLAEYRLSRVEIYEAQGVSDRAIDDLRWLALEAPAHLRARERTTRAIDAGRLQFDATQWLGRIRRLADAGWVERVDLELKSLAKQAGSVDKNPSLGAYLRGRARQVARVEQIDGAKLLERAADLRRDDATQIRIDAARLYVREGDAEHAVELYDRVARVDRARAEEARFYAARSLATFGDERRAIDRYSQLIERFRLGRWRRLADIERNLSWLALGDARRAADQLYRLAGESENRDQRPMLLELSGLAAFNLDQRELAVERWRRAASEAPLRLAFAFATARLRQVSADATSIVPAPVPLDRHQPVPLSRRTDQLLAFGLEDLAAEAQRSEDATSERSSRRAAVESRCRVWDKIGYGEHRFVISRSIRDSFDRDDPITAETRWSWECRFPRPYSAMVQEFESEFRLPEHLLYAVMRQESGFDPDITSSAGAIGLLQLLPQTASRLAEELHMTDEISLDEPRTNLWLGAAYLRRLLDTFNENLVLAIAAYNAGPQAVALWLRHARSDSVELFAARIPYAETQKYVERVVSNLLVYRQLHGTGRELLELPLSLPKELKDSRSLY